MATIESLEGTDSPFEQTLNKDHIDILATGWGSIYRTENSVYLKVQCGSTHSTHVQGTVHMFSAQYTCWEYWDAPLEDSCDIYEENSDESSKQTKESR